MNATARPVGRLRVMYRENLLAEAVHERDSAVAGHLRGIYRGNLLPKEVHERDGMVAGHLLTL